MGGGSRLLAALLVAAIAIAGCAATPEPVERDPIAGSFPRAGEIAELPYRVWDRTGFVDAVSVIVPGASVDGVSGVPGRDDALLVHWMGGTCDDEVRIVLERTLDGLALSVDTDAGCGLLAGFGRTLLLEFTAPIDPSTVSFTNVDGP